MSSRLVRWALCVAAIGLTACDPSDPCDPGYYEEHGACRLFGAAANGGDGDQADASQDDDGGESAEPADASNADPYASFGDECAEQADCPSHLVCGAPQLAYCTAVSCLADASTCPPGWTCLDVTGSSPDPSVTSVCLNL